MRLKLPVDFHPSRFAILTFALIIVCTASTGGIVLAARHSANTYGCLEFDGNGLSKGTLLDTVSGAMMRDRRAPPSLKPQLSVLPSPDGRYVASEEYQGVGQTPLNVMFITPVHSANAVKIEAGGVMVFLWSPDSQHIAYLWTDNANDYLVIVQPDGTNKRKTWIGPNPTYYALQSWSADSQYLMINVPFLRGRVTNFYAAADLRLALSIPDYLGISLGWSPQGHQLAHIYSDASGQAWLSIVSPENSKPIQFAITKTNNISGLGWSPDSRSIMLQYYSPGPRWFFSLYQLDGKVYPDIASVSPLSISSPLEFPIWSANGRVVMAVADDNGGQHDIIIFHLDTAIKETVISHVDKAVAYSPNKQHIAVAYQLNGQTSAEVINLDGSQHFTLVSGVDDLGDPSWSPDGQTVAVTWAVGQGRQRHVYLTWANADGTGQHTLDDHFWDVKAVHWLHDGHSLAYIAWRGEGFSVETADLQTGIAHQLASKLADVAMLGQDADNRLVFWWKGADGNGGIDAYQPDGKLVQRFPISGPLLTFDYARMFLAPDQRSMAIKLGPFGSESLQIATADGRSWVVQRGLSGLGDPIWSPDSQQITFTQSINHQPVTLEVVSASGPSRPRTFQARSGNYYNAMWSHCD